MIKKNLLGIDFPPQKKISNSIYKICPVSLLLFVVSDCEVGSAIKDCVLLHWECPVNLSLRGWPDVGLNRGQWFRS